MILKLRKTDIIQTITRFDLFVEVNSHIIVNLLGAKDIHLSTQKGIFSQYSLSLRPMDLEVLEVDLLSN